MLRSLGSHTLPTLAFGHALGFYLRAEIWLESIPQTFSETRSH